MKFQKDCILTPVFCLENQVLYLSPPPWPSPLKGEGITGRAFLKFSTFQGEWNSRKTVFCLENEKSAFAPLSLALPLQGGGDSAYLPSWDERTPPVFRVVSHSVF
jgi:hypothetical protein